MAETAAAAESAVVARPNLDNLQSLDNRLDLEDLGILANLDNQSVHVLY